MATDKTNLIQIKIEEPSVSHNFKNDQIVKDLEVDLDYKKYQSEVRTKNQFIRGVVKIGTLNGEKINFIKNDKIYSLDESGEFIERDRNENELSDSWFYGRFQYTKSIAGIDRYIFNHNIALYKKHRSKLHKLVSDLITRELNKRI